MNVLKKSSGQTSGQPSDQPIDQPISRPIEQPSRPSSGRPLVTAFVVWFVQFMAIWAAGEIWPDQWTANVLAWAVTAVALLALGVNHGRLKARHAAGTLPDWSFRFARGAVAIATAAVLFSALPSLVFLP